MSKIIQPDLDTDIERERERQKCGPRGIHTRSMGDNIADIQKGEEREIHMDQEASI